jgi:purine-binding chemotaxis protein CheW
MKRPGSGPERPDGGNRQPAAAKKEVLEQRARALARPAVPRAAPGDRRVLRFRIGSEIYAVALAHVRQVGPLGAPTPVPCTPAWVLGIVSLQGRVVSVLDLRQLFGLSSPAEATPRQEMACAVVLAGSDMELALAVDEVLGDAPWSSEAALAPPAGGVEGRSGHVKQVGPDGTILIDAGALLADASLVVEQTVEG